MANLIEMSEQLKAVPDDWLQQQISNPSGAVPPYLMLGEMNRRKSLRSRMAQPPSTTVAEDVMRSGQPAPPGMATADVLAQQPQMPQRPQVPRPGVPAPMPGGLSAAAPPAPQGPPAPQRMAKGGLIRAAGGMFVNPFDKFERYDEEEDRRGPGVYYDPAGSLIRRAGKPDMIIAAPPKPQFAPYREPTPVDIKMPDLGTMLEQVRAHTREPEGASLKLDQRIAELEQQRGNIRQPRTGDALIEMGLGMMASRSPYALGAMGEAGLGALQSHRQRQLQADAQRTQLSERLAAIEAARYEQAERGRRADLSAAQELASKQYGAEMVKAQLASTADSSRRQYDLAVAEAANRAALEGYQSHSGIQRAMLQAELQDRNLDPNDPAVRAQRLADEKELIKYRAQFDHSGGDGYGRLPAEWRIRDDAAALIRQEAAKWGVDRNETPDAFLGRVQQGTADKLRRGQMYDHLPQVYREVLADKVDTWAADRQKRDKGFIADITKRISDEKTKPLPEQQSDTYGTMKRSGSDKAVDVSDLRAKASAAQQRSTSGRYVPGQPAWAPPPQKKYIPFNDPGVPVRGVPDVFMKQGASPTASIIDPRLYQDEEDYFNQRNDPYYRYYLNNMMGGFAG